MVGVGVVAESVSRTSMILLEDASEGMMPSSESGVDVGAAIGVVSVGARLSLEGEGIVS